MMRATIQWLAVPALVFGVAPVQAVTYLSVEQAQSAIFPGRKLTPAAVKLSKEQRKAVEKAGGVRVRDLEPKVWSVEGGGWFIVDEVIGKHEFITYAVGLTADGAVKQIEVMDYREHHGGQVRDEKWRAQFIGKRHGAKLKLDEDIWNISGATLSSRHIAEGVRRLLAMCELVLKQ
jgi:hypothetical protein